MVFFDLSIGSVVYAFSELLGAPYQNPQILWFALPLLITLLIIELNLRSESEGVKQAIPNAIVLLFVALDLLRQVFSRGGFLKSLLTWHFLAALTVLLLSALMVYVAVNWRVFPNKTFLGVSMHLPVNTYSYAIIVVVHNNAKFTLSTIAAIAAFMTLLWALFLLAARLEPKTDYPERRRMDVFTPKRQKRSVELQDKQLRGQGKVDVGKARLVWIKKGK